MHRYIVSGKLIYNDVTFGAAAITVMVSIAMLKFRYPLLIDYADRMKLILRVCDNL